MGVGVSISFAYRIFSYRGGYKISERAGGGGGGGGGPGNC